MTKTEDQLAVLDLAVRLLITDYSQRNPAQAAQDARRIDAAADDAQRPEAGDELRRLAALLRG